MALRISRTVFSALSGMRLLACLIVAPQQGYDEPGIVSYAIRPFSVRQALTAYRVQASSSAAATVGARNRGDKFFIGSLLISPRVCVTGHDVATPPNTAAQSSIFAVHQ